MFFLLCTCIPLEEKLLPEGFSDSVCWDGYPRQPLVDLVVGPSKGHPRQLLVYLVAGPSKGLQVTIQSRCEVLLDSGIGNLVLPSCSLSTLDW